MNKFAITTLGCRVNQCESEAMANELAAHGWQPAGSRQTADVVVINTCCVTHKAAMQSRQAIRRARRIHPHARILVAGCYAQTEPEAIERVGNDLTIVGQGQKHRLAHLLRQEALGQLRWTDIGRERVFQSFPVPALGNRSRPLLKIQDGCDSFCTYCIVPYARGRSRSLSPPEVIQAVDVISRAGFHEVVLTGIHLGAYGLDLDPPTNLYALLCRLVQRQPIDRIRLSSIEPNEISDEIIDLVAQCPLFCRHFHIPLQSADNGILSAMGRPYTIEQVAGIVNRMAAKIPDAAIGADILVGFPGETERAFQHTVDWVDALPFTYLHVFPFSPRKKTAASHLAGRLPAEVMRLRSQTIRDLAMAKKTAFAKQLTGKTVQIIAEKSQGHDLVQAVSDNYMPVLVTGPLAPKALGWARIVSPTIPLGGALTSHPPDCPVRRP